jgi:hypothetical protein
MKTFKMIIVFVMLVSALSVSLKAEGESKKVNSSFLNSDLIVLLNKDDGTMGLSLGFNFRVIPRLSMGAEVVLGMSGDGEAIYTLFPTASYHFKMKSKKWDLFTGIGAAVVMKKPDYNSTFDNSLFGILGARVKFSRHLGASFRIFAGERIIGGGSLGITYSK